MPVDIKKKKDINEYINEFWKEQKENVYEKYRLLKNEAKKIDDAKVKWEVKAKAEACVIARAKAEAKAEAKAIAKVKADLKAIAKEIALDIANAKADAKAIAQAKAEAKAEAKAIALVEADAKAIAKLKAEWQAIFQEHDKIMKKVRADAKAKVCTGLVGLVGLVGLDCDYPKGPECMKALSGSQSSSCNSEKTKRNLHEYNLFYKEQYPMIKEVKPELKNHEIMVEIAKLWNLKKLLSKNLAPPALNLSINYDVNPIQPVTPMNPVKSVNKDDFGGASWWWINKGEEIMLNRR